MKKVIIGCILAISLPISATAGYDAERIKSFVSGAKGIFQVTGWKRSENGNALVAITNLKNVVISISNNRSSIYSYLPKFTAMDDVPCLALGNAGTEARTDEQRYQLVGAINSALSGKNKTTKINGVIFKAATTQNGGVLELSCHVMPSKT